MNSSKDSNRTRLFKASEEAFRSVSGLPVAALKLSESMFPKLFHMNPSACGLSDTETRRYIEVNKAFCTLFGFTREEVIGKTIFELEIMSPEISMAILQNADNSGAVHHKEAVLKAKNGDIKHVLLFAENITLENKTYRFTVAQDITERKRTEEAIRNVQKLESLGILAGGIAHDFNNLMGGIFGYIDIALKNCKDGEVSKDLIKAMDTIDRARALTQQLLTFAKGGAPIRKVGRLFPFIRETARFALSGSNVSCNFDVPENLWTSSFDRNQIGQVIDNLIINAKQAMPFGGIIDLIARNISLLEKEVPTLPQGDYVKISVKDRGIGIAKELLQYIFDPFFTTKPKGHGLGLSTCYSIINRHGGFIDVESEPGKGSAFHVYLPASPDMVASGREIAAQQHKGSGTFLIMDDEEIMRDIIRKMLAALGYHVVCKENGRDAIDFFASATEANQKIVGVIFDLTIAGGMGGKEAVSEIRKFSAGAEIPVFVASGYADDPVMKNPAEYGFTASICKPFLLSELSEMLNNYVKAC